MTFHKGQRVSTPRGPGIVLYQRMAPPDYSAPISVAVTLDCRRDDPRYQSTSFAAVDVHPIEGGPKTIQTTEGDPIVTD